MTMTAVMAAEKMKFWPQLSAESEIALFIAASW